MAERSSTIPSLDPDNLTPAHLEGFYGKLQQFDPDPTLMRNMGQYLGQKFMPDRVTAGDGVREKLTELVLRNEPIVWAPNHIHAEDQFNVIGGFYGQLAEGNEEGEGALFDNEDVRNSIIERLRVLFTVDYLKNRERAKAALGLTSEQLIEFGGIPVVRSEDDESAEIATPFLTDAAAGVAARGYHLFGFSEGTRNTDSPETVQRLKMGMANMAFRAIEFGRKSKKRFREPAVATVGISRDAEGAVGVHFGEVITGYKKGSPKGLIDRMHTGIQAAVDASRLP